MNGIFVKFSSIVNVVIVKLVRIRDLQFIYVNLLVILLSLGLRTINHWLYSGLD
jgi:hypothetical protein